MDDQGISKIKAEVVLQLPADKVVVERSYVEDLQEYRDHHSLHGITWSMADLERVTSRKRNWIKQHIIDPYYKQLSSEYGGPMVIPMTNRDQYAIDAERMADFLSLHFNDIYENRKEA